MKISKYDVGAGLLIVAAISFLILAVMALRYFTRDPNMTAGRVITDTKTGCQYVAYGDGLTPRRNPDGSQICLKVLP
jgi:hypothetical protein